jgi:hypothetical protein
MNYKQDLKIDIWQLHIEARDQPQLLMKYAEAYVFAKAEVAKLERKIKVVRAQVGQRVRSENTKVTVDFIKEMIELDPEVIQIENDIIDAYTKRDLLYSAVDAFKDRKYEISELADFYKSGYYSNTMTVPEKEIIFESDERRMQEELQEEKVILEEIKQRKLQK